MTLAGTCLKMVARATFCDSSLWDCCSVLFIEKVHLWCHLASNLSACCLLKRSTFGVISLWEMQIYFCFLVAVQSWILKRYESAIHSTAIDSLCRMIKMHALSIQLLNNYHSSTINFQKWCISLVWFSSFSSDNILNFQFRVLIFPLISSKRIELYPRLDLSFFSEQLVKWLSWRTIGLIAEVCLSDAVEFNYSHCRNEHYYLVSTTILKYDCCENLVQFGWNDVENESN
jgi:hypothetical protein